MAKPIGMPFGLVVDSGELMGMCYMEVHSGATAEYRQRTTQKHKSTSSVLQAVRRPTAKQLQLHLAPSLSAAYMHTSHVIEQSTWFNECHTVVVSLVFWVTPGRWLASMFSLSITALTPLDECHATYLQRFSSETSK